MIQNDPWAGFEQVSAPAQKPVGFIPGSPKPEKREAPAGYRFGPSGNLEYIPGGPADPNSTPDKPNLPVGWQMGPDGKAQRIPGLPTTGTTGGGKPIPSSEATAVQTQVDAFAALSRAIDGFKDDYAGKLSGIENTLQGYLPVGTAGQRDWWADFKMTDAQVRNALFGASLSDQEKASYAETTITPGLRAEEVKRNLKRRLDLAKSVLKRRVDYMRANGYEPAAIDALVGEFGQALGAPSAEQGGAAVRGGPLDFGPQAGEVAGRKMSPEQARAYDAFLSGNPNATAEQLMAFGSKMGFEINNAQEVIDYYRQSGEFATGQDAMYRNPNAEEIKAGRDQTFGKAGGEDLLLQGATLGLSDEAAGVGGALANIITSPFSDQAFDPVGAYQNNRDADRMRIDEARQNMGGAGTALEIGGSLLSGNVTNALARLPTLGGRAIQGAKAGAAGGGIAGFGYGEGPNSLLTGMGGAAVGAGLGAALPVVGQVVSNRYQGLQRLTGRDPQLPRRIVSEAMDADGNTPQMVGRTMDEAHGRGSPYMIADTGDNARGLLASVARQPGGAKTIGKTAVIERQTGQADRISEAVVRDLGPTANIREMGEELIERARTASKPHYDAFRAAPGASVVQLDDLLTRPAFQRALKNARDLAAEEGRDPTALGFQFNEAGDVVLDRVPSWETLDFVKRGLDDVVEGFRDSTTGKLNLNTGNARATNATLRTLIGRMDKANPHYAAARAAYAGPAKMKEAMQKGVKALSRAPDDIMAMMKSMGDSEQEAFRLGIRKAIVDLLGSRKDGGDKVSLLIGSPKSRAVLSRVFGGKAEFERFIATLRDEEAMGLTYKAVATGSPTAERGAVDATTNDGGLAETAVDAVLRGSRDTMWGSLVAALQKLREVDRFGAGKAGESARESIAALLTETDPKVLRELVIASQKAAAQQKIAAGRKTRNAARIGRNAGDLSGMATGSLAEQRR